MTATPPLAQRQISVILPSFRDARIVNAIASIRLFDDCGAVRLVVIDGGSPPELVAAIQRLLNPDDVLVSEPDKGIFDGLNKGLDRVATPYVGWLGSDDLYSGAVKASEVIARLTDHDLFVCSLYLTDGPRILRYTHARYAAMGLVRFGLHNPHYATFGRAATLCAERFDIANIGADIGYFLRIFAKRPRVAATPKVAVLQEQGGFSTQSKRKILRINREVYRYYRERQNPVVALAAVAAKLGYKSLGALRYRLLPQRWDARFPQVAPLSGPAPALEAAG